MPEFTQDESDSAVLEEMMEYDDLGSGMYCSCVGVPKTSIEGEECFHCGLWIEPDEELSQAMEEEARRFTWTLPEEVCSETPNC